MSAVRFPIAANAEAALSAPLGRAARRSEAALAAGAEVAFSTEAVGPAFATREAALAAYAGRIDDERAESPASILPEDRYCELRELAAARPPRPGAVKSLRPIYRNGRRWPAAPPPAQTVWRLSISYWRLQAIEAAADLPAAGAGEDAKALRARLARPLRPVKPQQPLDIG